MRSYKRNYRPGQRIWFSLCCLTLLFLAGCSSPTSTTLQQQVTTLPTAVSTAIPKKPAEPGTEEWRRAMLPKVQQIIQGMSLDDELAQMLIVEYLGQDYQESGLQEMIAQQHAGGFLIQPSVNGSHNWAADATISSVTAFNAQAQKDAKIPLMIGIDQEGGDVDKLSQLFGTSPAAADLTATGNSDQAYQTASKDTQEMKQIGINVDFAPVVDVGPSTNLLLSRQFSDNPQTVTTYAGKFLTGLQEHGIPGVLKHFPGLGSLPNGDLYDPHQHITHNTRSLADFENTDFVPYKQLIAHNQPAMIMTTDEYLDAVDPNLPAVISPKVISIIRNEMNYQGLIITDGIYMLTYTGYSDDPAAMTAQAIIAGNDIVEGLFTSDTVSQCLQDLKQAITDGKLPKAQVDASVQRILLMKMQYGIIPPTNS